MPANIYIYCPAGTGGLCRSDLEVELQSFFGAAAEDCGAGGGIDGFNLDYELCHGEDPDAWAGRLKTFLEQSGVRLGTVFDVFPHDWLPGMATRRIRPFGADEWRTAQ